MPSQPTNQKFAVIGLSNDGVAVTYAQAAPTLLAAQVQAVHHGMKFSIILTATQLAELLELVESNG